MTIFSHDDMKIVRAKASAVLNDILRASRAHPLLFLTSGGSTLSLLDTIDPALVSSNWTLGVLDERYSTDPSVNNFSQVVATPFYAKATAKGCAVIDTRVQKSETLAALTARYEAALRDWKMRNPNGRVIITQGMGVDGHTAGILPMPDDSTHFDELFLQPEHWAVGYEISASANPYARRVTTTLSFLCDVVDQAIVYCVGREKEEAWARSLATEGSLAATPMRVIHAMKSVQVFTNIHG